MPNGFFQKSIVRNQYVLGADSGDYTFDLPTANYLQGLVLRVQNTNGSTSNNARTIEEDITKIEIEADGVLIYSASGINTRRFEHFDIGNFPAMDESQNASEVQYALFPIKFGRNPSDKEVILPAHKFSTLTCKVTWAFTDSTTAGWTTSETNAKLDVLATYLVSPERTNTPFLKKIQSFSNTLSTIQEETVDLATGSGAGAYRRICIVAYEAAIQDGVDVDRVELLVNNSDRIFNSLWSLSQMEDQMRYSIGTVKAIRAYVADNDTVDTRVSRITGLSASAGATTHIAGVDVVAGDRLTVALEDDASTAISTAELFHIVVHSNVVPHSTMIDLGTDNLSDSLYVGKGSGVSELQLKLNVAAAGALVSVISEQLVSL